MASRYDKKQGIDGIATLTNDPIAVQNIRKAKADAAKKEVQSDKNGKTK